MEILDRISITWSPVLGSCSFLLRLPEGAPAVLEIQPDESASPEHWRFSTANLAGLNEIELPRLRESLPPKSAVAWEDAAIVGLGAIGLRGKGDGIRLWLATVNPSGFSEPTPEQTASAYTLLSAVRDVLWPD